MLGACGRIQFDRLDSADATTEPDVAESACVAGAPFGAPKPIPELNDPVAFDGTLRLLPDELSGYFWSRRDGGDGDLYFAERTLDTPFSIRLVQGVDTPMSELDPTITSDGAILVFRRSNPGNDLFVATQAGVPDTFSMPTPIAAINTADDETQSFMPLDRDELYFQSPRTGGGDVYVSKRNGTSFSSPAPVAGIASSSDEGDPVVTPDGLTIYFRSDRAATLGGYNIYVATRTEVTDAFSNVELVPNVNTDADEGPSWISPDDCRLYLSSDVAGSNDIYVATRGVP
jgi:hypothetical protein